MNRIFLSFALFAVAAVVTWKFPLFHVVPLHEAVAERQAEAFDAEKYAVQFWDNRLIAAFDDAANAATVFSALDDDADAARKEYGRTVGMSRATFFFVRGSGSFSAIERSRVGVSLEPASIVGEADLWLITGPVFGNAVRDATGLLKSQEFPNSQHFNELGAALNALVEQQVQPVLRERAQVGQRVRFVACAEVPGGVVKQPLTMIPLHVSFD